MDGSESFTLLCQLAQEGDNLPTLEHLLSQIRDVNDTDEEGHTPIWYAARLNPSLAVVKTLLSAGAVIDVPLIKEALLHNSNTDITIELYRKRAPVTSKEKGELFLLAAASQPDDRLVRFFVAEGADVQSTLPMDLYPQAVDDEIEKDDQTVRQNALVVAIYENPHPETMVKTLLELGVNPNTIDIEGYPVLVHALDTLPVVRLLIQGGADVNISDYKGMTALMHACASEANEVALALIEMGAEIHIVCKEQQTALHYALSCHIEDNSDVVQALIAHGADVNQVDNEGFLPLDLARFNFCNETIIAALERAGAVSGAPFIDQ